MKLDEELWLDHGGAFQMDNEENRAERSFNGDEDNSDYDHSPPSRIPSSELSNSPWPRQSMHMFSPHSFSFARIGSLRESGKSPCGRDLDDDSQSSLSKPLISERCRHGKNNAYLYYPLKC
ncbi:hypothetical protein SLA2020_506810 [Shorea laevis]